MTQLWFHTCHPACSAFGFTTYQQSQVTIFFCFEIYLFEKLCDRKKFFLPLIHPICLQNQDQTRPKLGVQELRPVTQIGDMARVLEPPLATSQVHHQEACAGAGVNHVVGEPAAPHWPHHHFFKTVVFIDLCNIPNSDLVPWKCCKSRNLSFPYWWQMLYKCWNPDGENGNAEGTAFKHCFRFPHLLIMLKKISVGINLETSSITNMNYLKIVLVSFQW